MHQVLLVSEVLLEIFAHVDQISSTNPPSSARKFMAALARTCKAFHEPAMDLLWAEVYQLEPLLGCVARLHPLIYRTRHKWGYSGLFYNWEEFQDLEPISALEAHQFLRHSTRVRSLNIMSDGLLHLLSAIPIETCVFPRLRFLTWKPSTGKYLDPFLSPNLSHCVLLTVNKYLQSIVTRCAALEHLEIITLHASTVDDLSLLSDSVRLCKQLTSLSCPPLDWAAWKHLSNLPTLLGVQIDTTRSAFPWPLERDMVNSSPFLNLRDLSILHSSAAYIIAVMEHSQFPSLTRFGVKIKVPSSAEAQRLFCALSHCKASQTLEEIVIFFEDYQDEDEDPPPPGNSLTMLPHFLSFTQLRSLRLYLDGSHIYLNNDILLEAMSAWPHMHTLEMRDSGLDPSLVTFNGLITALRQCPHLHTLQVAIDLVDIDIDPNAEPIQHPSLRTFKLELDTSEFQIVDAEAFARIIFTWFPCIDQVGERADGEWDKVNMHVRELKAAALHAAETASNT
ncbi:hypothetical protein DEU56DRAFT_909088 [Suillus clintonianus]|uniref:uncharacterized protein n=1 Tax=Suillus clintonianus TaxID=1904413 RepID=UPI001B869D15|nr:uncharacterized protein DEU56DRAFT_909088 [Suillus clintonianus]KAG2148774.1 hypothetical protein DEU56DRAFT_909088 [Suillus clintonianus]